MIKNFEIDDSAERLKISFSPGPAVDFQPFETNAPQPKNEEEIPELREHLELAAQTACGNLACDPSVVIAYSRKIGDPTREVQGLDFIQLDCDAENCPLSGTVPIQPEIAGAPSFVSEVPVGIESAVEL